MESEISRFDKRVIKATQLDFCLQQKENVPTLFIPTESNRNVLFFLVVCMIIHNSGVYSGEFCSFLMDVWKHRKQS